MISKGYFIGFKGVVTFCEALLIKAEINHLQFIEWK